MMDDARYMIHEDKRKSLPVSCFLHPVSC